MLTTRSVSFDLDGVLFKSRELVKKAYAEVGVEMADEHWGKSWTEWLHLHTNNDRRLARQLHEDKNVVYAQLIHDAEVVPTTARLLAEELLHDSTQRIVVVTSASTVGAMLVLARLHLEQLVVHSGLTRDQKVQRSRQLKSIHIDDDEYVTDRLAFGIHYINQPLQELRERVTWMQSS